MEITINTDNQDMYKQDRNFKSKRIPKTKPDDKFDLYYRGDIVKRNLNRNLAYALKGQYGNNPLYNKKYLKLIPIK